MMSYDMNCVRACEIGQRWGFVCGGLVKDEGLNEGCLK